MSDDVRVTPCCELDGQGAVAGLSEDFDVFCCLQNHPESQPEQLLVIDEHDLDHHSALAASRTVTRDDPTPGVDGTGPKRPAVEVGSFPHAFDPMSPGPVRSPA